MWRLLCFGAVLAGLCSTAPCFAHPVPRRCHDRTLTIRPLADRLRIDYLLEVDEWTVVFEDLPALSDRLDLKALRKPDDFYSAFVKHYAPILADNLIATANGQPLTFTCTQHSYRLLDHVRCEFVFEAAWQPSTGQPVQVQLREGNYELEQGRIRMTLEPAGNVACRNVALPTVELQNKPPGELGPGDDERLRAAGFALEITGSGEPPAQAAPMSPPGPMDEGTHSSLFNLLLDSQRGLVALLCLAALFGAAHALTPGHGKTLVAAYLVGERGTLRHAVILGLVTTLTHTSSVLVLAAILCFWFPDTVPADVQMLLGLGGGLLIAGLGGWLLLRRLSGGADHVHIGGGHHHHHHHHAELPAGPVSWWGLVILGISGGIIPCWDAIAMLAFAVAAQKLWLALPLLLAFSAGLAGVLVGLGIAVVYLKGFASSHWSESRLVRGLPLLSAALVTTLGLLLCYQSVHPGGR